VRDLTQPTDEELLAIAKKAVGVSLTDWARANVEISAQAVLDGETEHDETYNLALIKMLLLTNHRVAELRKEVNNG
jgi:hypothetical protein